jgi:phytoene dehydrogenase-like protein
VEERRTDVVIVGAGIGGLACARMLQKAGHKIVLVEAQPAIGGRLQTDAVDGFLMDRGFQVVPLAYPAAEEMLDYDELAMKRFPPGVRIRAGGRFHILADPLREPRYFLRTISSSIGSVGDRFLLLKLARQVSTIDLERIFSQPEQLVEDFWRDYGFSRKMVTQFLRPFMAGICLDPEVRVTSRFFKFMVRMFGQGDAAVPARGMGAIPAYLARDIAPDALLLNSRVQRLEGTSVHLQSGKKVSARAVVLAADGPETARLLGKRPDMQSCREVCFYYGADQPPVRAPFLTLNGEEFGIVNSVNFPSMVASDYAPAGKSLISAVVPGHPEMDSEEMETTVRGELTDWFGPSVSEWKLLRTYTIEHALPRPEVPSPDPFQAPIAVGEGIFNCSEYGTMPATQWALMSASRVAEAVRAYLS